MLCQLWQRIPGTSQGMLQILYKDILHVFTTLVTASSSLQFWADSWHVPLCSYWHLLVSFLALCFSSLFFFGVAFCIIILDSWCCVSCKILGIAFRPSVYLLLSMLWTILFNYFLNISDPILF